MKELHSFGWYAARIKDQLPKEAFQPVPTRLIGGLVYLIIALAGIFAIAIFDFHFWIHLVIAIILGFSYAGLAFLGHDILHGTVVRNPRLRNTLGAICLWSVSTGPRLWRKWHNVEHHVHTQDEHSDPDAWATLEEIYERPIMRWVYRLPQWIRSLIGFSFYSVTFSVHSLRMFKQYIGQFKPKQRPMVWLQLLLPWAFWIGLLFVVGFEMWFFIYLLPLLITNFILISYISTNHRLNPLVEVNDPLANSLSVTVPKWMNVLHFNFSYHTEHHLFPAMSPKYYPLVKEKIKEKWPEKYHEMSMARAFVALWKTPRLYFQSNQFVDPYREKVYDSLGYGLNPEQKINPRPWKREK